MLRRSHRKSTTGCVQCKKRHVKCDEGRPVCRLCVLSQRGCSFQTTPSATQLQSPTTNATQTESVHPDTALSPFVLPNLLLLNPIASNISTEPNASEPINLTHMELLIHIITAPEMYNLGACPSSEHTIGIRIGLCESLSHTFLLHQILAFSARHLAYQHPARAAFYTAQSTALQTQALTLFNTIQPAIMPQNCVAILIFSSILAHHMLTDTLARRDASLAAWLSHYTQCIETHRGIYAIAQTAWPALMVSDLAPILDASKRFTSRVPRGAQCAGARALMEKSARLDDGERATCRLALGYLQVGFDAVFAGEEEGRFHMVFTWTMLASAAFTRLLAQKRPEALVLLTYYAWLLHCARGEWQVGGAGVYVFGLVAEELGDEWAEWIEGPRQGIIGSE